MPTISSLADATFTSFTSGTLIYAVQTAGSGGFAPTLGNVGAYLSANLGSANATTINVTGSGSFGGSVTAGTSFVAGSLAGFTWSGTKSRIESDANGNITLSNNARNGFNLLKFGNGTNAGVPAIQVLNATTLSLRDGTTATNVALTADRLTLGSIATVAGSASIGLSVGSTGASPGWYVQLDVDTSPRIRIGLNNADTASVAFGPGNAGRDLFLERAGAASLRQGGADTTAPVAQSLVVQNVLTGTADTAGANRTYDGSAGSGLGNGGNQIFRTAPALTTTGTAQNSFENSFVLAASGTTLLTPRTPITIQPNVPTQNLSTLAGNGVTIAASAAIIGSINPGAAVGGTLALAGGDATRQTSGNAIGGGIIGTAGMGIGNGNGGAVTWVGGFPGTVTGAAAGAAILQGGSTATASASIIAGGAAQVLGGAGAPSTAATAGTGGAAVLQSGLGATTTGNGGTAGNSGAVNAITGAGGNATNANGGVGGNSADATLGSGVGGNATGGSGTRNGGNSGNVILAVGAVGTGASANGTTGVTRFSHAGTVTHIFPASGVHIFGASAAATVPMLKPTAQTTIPVMQARAGDDSGFAYFQSAGAAVSTAIFSVNATTTVAGIPALSVNVATGKTYSFESFLPATLDVTGGYNFGTGGTVTATSIRAALELYNDSTNGFGLANFTTGLGSISSGATIGPAAHARIVGTIVVNAGGTLTLTFTQGVASGTSSILSGAWMRVTQLD